MDEPLVLSEDVPRKVKLRKYTDFNHCQSAGGNGTSFLSALLKRNLTCKSRRVEMAWKLSFQGPTLNLGPTPPKKHPESSGFLPRESPLQHRVTGKVCRFALQWHNQCCHVNCILDEGVSNPLISPPHPPKGHLDLKFSKMLPLSICEWWNKETATSFFFVPRKANFQVSDEYSHPHVQNSYIPTTEKVSACLSALRCQHNRLTCYTRWMSEDCWGKPALLLLIWKVKLSLSCMRATPLQLGRGVAGEINSCPPQSNTKSQEFTVWPSVKLAPPSASWRIRYFFQTFS